VAIFVDESVEHVDPFDAPDIVNAGGCRRRRGDGHVEVDAAVRACGVVVRDVLGQDVFEVAAVAGEYPVEAFGTHGADPAFRVGVRLRRPWWNLDCFDAGRGEHRVEGGGELRVPVADQEAEPEGVLVDVHQQVAGCLGDP
jgi:hypothetical protein